MTLEPRSESELQQRQRAGDLRVCSGTAFRARVAAEGLASAYAATDVVVAANAEFTDQASLLLQLGPTDPPIRIRQAQLDGVSAQGGSGSCGDQPADRWWAGRTAAPGRRPGSGPAAGRRGGGSGAHG